MRAFTVLALLHSCRGLQLFGQPTSLLLKKTIKGVVATIAASTILASDGSWGHIMRPPPASAALANIADVGVREFLVKVS
jgi:hypothetical protein